MKTWMVTAKCCGKILTLKIEASSRRKAEEFMLKEIGFSLESHEVVSK